MQIERQQEVEASRMSLGGIAVTRRSRAAGFHALRRTSTRRRRRANLMILVSLAGTLALAALLGSVLSR